jgi:hypothetical protein
VNSVGANSRSRLQFWILIWAFFRHSDFAIRHSLPKFPIAFPNNPKAEQEICDRVRGHRVTQPFFPANQSLIREAAQNPGEPFVMCEAEDR